jgi:uncharacterized protein (DUF1697 family)
MPTNADDPEAMALVVFLKGVNVGGHRTFRPSVLANELTRFDVVYVGAAGTFVIRKAVSAATLRAEIVHRLPFKTDVMICKGSDILRLATTHPFAGKRSASDIVRFVSLLGARTQSSPPIPLNLPHDGPWCLKVITCQGRFVCGLYRREMKAIRYLGQLEKVFGVPVTTRNWNTMLAIIQILKGAGGVNSHA